MRRQLTSLIVIILVAALLIFNMGFVTQVENSDSFTRTFFEFLSKPIISNLLLIIGFITFMIELIIPGFGIWGLSSTISFFLFFASNMYVGNANWISVFLFVIGLLLLLFEIFIPGFGVVGITGFVSIMFGVGTSMSNLNNALTTILITLIVVIVGLFFVFKHGSKTVAVKRLTLHQSIQGESGVKTDAEGNPLVKVGMKAVALTNLRPYGFIEIQGNKLDATTESDFIDRDSEVVVVRIEGRKIIVKEA